MGHSGVGGTVTFHKGSDSRDQRGIKAALFAVEMHFILMRVQQFKPLNDSHANQSSYSAGENTFPLCDLRGVPGRRPFSAFGSVSTDAELERGTKELSQQPSTDFGCGALQMQKRRLLVLIFTG